VSGVSGGENNNTPTLAFKFIIAVAYYNSYWDRQFQYEFAIIKALIYEREY